jgi:hypothetical protein
MKITTHPIPKWVRLTQTTRPLDKVTTWTSIEDANENRTVAVRVEEKSISSTFIDFIAIKVGYFEPSISLPAR